MAEKKFISDVAEIAVPASLQTLLQISVLSLTDQIMIGQLGSVSVAAVGLANKFSSSYSLLFRQQQASWSHNISVAVSVRK